MKGGREYQGRAPCIQVMSEGQPSGTPTVKAGGGETARNKQRASYVRLGWIDTTFMKSRGPMDSEKKKKGKKKSNDILKT